MTADRRLGWRRGLLTGGCVLVLGGATGGLALTLAGRPAAAAGGQTRLTTAPVVRTGLVNTVQVSGTLGYAGSATVINQTVGTAIRPCPSPGRWSAAAAGCTRWTAARCCCATAPGRSGGPSRSA